MEINIKFVLDGLEMSRAEAYSSHRALTRRLATTWRMLRARRNGVEIETGRDGRPTERGYSKLMSFHDIPDDDYLRLETVAHALYAARTSAPDAFSHLNAPDKTAILRLTQQGVSVVGLSSIDRADEIAAELESEFPWMSEINGFVWQMMRFSYRNGNPGVVIPPTLLNGPPGVGKSAWARALASKIGVPAVIMDGGTESAVFAISGVQRGWSGAEPGRPLVSIIQHRIANPIFVIDEIEKSAGVDKSRSGHDVSLVKGLLPLLEKSTAARWQCPYYRAAFDMSHISWIFTSNSTSGLPAPILSRCHVHEIPPLTIEQLQRFAIKRGREQELSDASIGSIVDALDASRGARERPSLRTVQRILTLGRVMQDRPILH